MSVADKTLLLGMQFSRLGAPFAPVSAKSSVDSQGFDFSRNGGSFFGQAGTSTPSYATPIPFPSRLGAPFRDLTSKNTLDASGFDFSRLGASYWVLYSPPTTGFNTTRFFMMF